MAPLRISIVTPCRNAERLVGRTVESVVEQTAVRSGRVALEYLVVDGASSDRTLEVVRSSARARAEILSEPDTGMYDALAKGLRAVTGDVVAYLNAGDAYSATAFEVVADLFSRPDVQWLTGLRVLCNVAGAVVSAHLPVPYRRTFLAKGAHDGVRLDFVQQESTFWRRSLHAQLDLRELATFRLAGDSWMWSRFARAADLHVVEAYLGGFTRQPGQLSERVAEMRAELGRFAGPLSPGERTLAWLDRAAFYLPPLLKKRLSPARLFRYDFARERWA
jgi:glycosyltransferase involved in cell wall biosynthesis